MLFWEQTVRLIHFLVKWACVSALSLALPAMAQTSPIEAAWRDSYALEAAGKYAAAASALDAVPASSPDHDFVLMRRGWLNYLQGRHNDAIRDYNLALNANPRSLEAMLGATLPLMAQQRWREAGAMARKVIAVSPWDYTAHVRLMVCEEGEKRWQDLAQHAAEFSARFPSDATGLVYLARAEAWLGNVRRAQLAYQRVLARLPTHVEALNYLKNNP
jgi:tetratricopeptide (TPR) repeat protein